MSNTIITLHCTFLICSHVGNLVLPSLDFFFKILFIHSQETQRHRQREKKAPGGEPNVGLDPRTPGSRPGPKADAQLLSHPGVPDLLIFV